MYSMYICVLNKNNMKFTTKAQARLETGISYLGSVNMTTKHEKATAYNELTYALYLSPAKMSGYEVCPMRNAECTALCLNESGMAKIHTAMINNGRIKKTKLFFEHREFFMDWMIAEIESTRLKAIKKDMKFSVRLNNTSDISPISFYKDVDGKKKNILEIYPDVQFYDYTKVPNRLEVAKKYPNFDLTFSFSGFNMETCIEMLSNNINVAMVFSKVPETFMGYEVIDGDKYDMRYLDKKPVIVGLKFKKVKNKVTPDSKFVIQNNLI